MDSSKGRYAIGRGSIVSLGLFGLLASQGRVLAVGRVVVELHVVGSALGRVGQRSNSRYSRGNSGSKVGNVGCTDSGLSATGRTGAAFLPWIPELPVFSLLGRSKLVILC